MNEIKPLRFFLKCSRCKTCKRVEVAARYETRRQEYRDLAEPPLVGYVRKIREYRVRVPISDPHGERCACGREFKVEQITGRASDHACNAKCLASKGPLCECACGGENHGKNHG